MKKGTIVSLVMLLNILLSVPAFSQLLNKILKKSEPSAIGNMVFSTAPFENGKDDPSKHVHEFSLTDRMYATLFFDKSMQEACAFNPGNGDFEIGYQLYFQRGKAYEYTSFVLTEKELSQSYYTIEIVPDPARATHTQDAPFFSGKLFNQYLLAKGNNSIDLTVKFGSVILGKATIKFNWDGNASSLEKIKKDAPISAATASANFTELPEDFMTSRPYGSDEPELNTEKLKKMALEFLQANISGDEQPVEIKKLVIARYASDPVWVIAKNDLGVPLSKSTYGKLLVVWKAANGNCYFSAYKATGGSNREGIGMGKEYEGGGKYGALRLYWAGCSPTYGKCRQLINCEKVK